MLSAAYIYLIEAVLSFIKINLASKVHPIDIVRRSTIHIAAFKAHKYTTEMHKPNVFSKKTYYS